MFIILLVNAELNPLYQPNRMTFEYLLPNYTALISYMGGRLTYRHTIKSELSYVWKHYYMPLFRCQSCHVPVRRESACRYLRFKR